MSNRGTPSVIAMKHGVHPQIRLDRYSTRCLPCETNDWTGTEQEMTMYLSPPPLSLLHSRRAALTQARSALPDAPVVPDAGRRARRGTTVVARSFAATRRAGARSLHRLGDAVAPTERSALVR